MDNIERLQELGYEDFIFFINPEYDAAIVGMSEDNRVVYDYDEMVRCLVDRDGMDELSAMEFIDYNVIRALPYAGSGAPIIIYKI